jgi:glutathione S-transferase
MAELPILYSFRRCPYAMRARLAVLASDTVCEIREVKLSAKPAELLALSPKATVPVLDLRDGAIIDQSLDIMRWALGRSDPRRLARSGGRNAHRAE